jgi:ParB/RepB/Spo0J family partition protein
MMTQQVAVRNIPIGQLSISKFNVRKKIGDLSELVLSVKSVGVLEPVIARPVGKNFEIIIGSRRLAASKKAGLKTVPTIVKTLSDDEALVESLTENLQRGDLEEEEIVGAYNMLHAFDPKRWTQQAFANKMGKSQQWVNGLLSAYQLLVKLEKAGVVKGMAAHPREEEKEKGIAPVEHLRRIEEGVRTMVRSGALSESQGEKKRVELAKGTLDLPQQDLTRVLDRAKMYPEKPVEKIKEEALGGIAVKTYIPAKVARRMEEQTGRPVDEALTTVLERGLESVPASVGEEKSPMKHWAEGLATDSPSVQEGKRWEWNAKRMGKVDFFTTSYQGRDLDSLIETWKALGIKKVVDVRDSPHSQFRPEMNKPNLEKMLPKSGIEYENISQLGVPRSLRDELAKTGNYDALWKKYDAGIKDDYLVRKDKQEILLALDPHEGRVAYLCVERDPTKCHRHRIALSLEKMGWRSFDV